MAVYDSVAARGHVFLVGRVRRAPNLVDRQADTMHDRVVVDDPLGGLHVVPPDRVRLVLDRDAIRDDCVSDVLGVGSTLLR